MKQLTFALYFAKRGYFTEALVSGARKEMVEAVKNAGFQYHKGDQGCGRGSGY